MPILDRRRSLAAAIAVATVASAAAANHLATELQPVLVIVVFGVALATAIDPGHWLAHVALVVVGMAGSEWIAAAIVPTATNPEHAILTVLGAAGLSALIVRGLRGREL